MPDKMKFVTIPLHISAVIYVLVGLAFPLFFSFPLLFGRRMDAGIMTIFLFVGLAAFLLSLAIAIFAEIVVNSLKQGRYWAWIAAICLAALYIPSAFCILGIFMLIGLLDAEVSKFCAKKGPGQA